MERIEEDLKVEDLIFFKYAPITSVDVERSFHFTKINFQIIDAVKNFIKLKKNYCDSV